MIIAIIVTYNPDMAVFESLLSSIIPQVDHVVVVDNGSSLSLVKTIEEMAKTNTLVSLIKNIGNLGVATALNQGCEFSRENGADYVLLLDQDSVPEANMVRLLCDALKFKVEKGEKVGAVGPGYSVFKGSDLSPFVRLSGCRLVRVDCDVRQLVSVDHLITSGSVIPMPVWQDVGEMEEDLFISYVDTEWCIRAKSKGYQLYGVGSAKMSHDIGDDVITLCGRKLPVYSSLRYYYTVRNNIWLIRQNWMPLEWKVLNIKRLVIFYVLYSLLVGERYNNWKMMMKGLWHGLKGRMGKIS